MILFTSVFNLIFEDRWRHSKLISKQFFGKKSKDFQGNMKFKMKLILIILTKHAFVLLLRK